MSPYPPQPPLPELPALVRGWVAHRRREGLRRGFRHRVYLWLIDLDDVPRPAWYLRPFAGFRSADHVGDPSRSLRENVQDLLARNGIDLGPQGRIVMLAGARVLGHLFDPLSVFWCLRTVPGAPENHELVCVVAEVHNTYGQRHAYLLRPDRGGQAHTDKEFYVSPFFDVSGGYDLRFRLDAEGVGVGVTLRAGEQVRFQAGFSGTPRPATPRALLLEALRHPLMPQQVSALIRWHGVRLWARRLPVVPRPAAAPAVHTVGPPGRSRPVPRSVQEGVRP